MFGALARAQSRQIVTTSGIAVRKSLELTRPHLLLEGRARNRKPMGFYFGVGFCNQ
jgi:hypothetical protein